MGTQCRQSRGTRHGYRPRLQLRPRRPELRSPCSRSSERPLLVPLATRSGRAARDHAARCRPPCPASQVRLADEPDLRPAGRRSGATAVVVDLVRLTLQPRPCWSRPAATSRTCWRIDAGVPNRSTLTTHALAGMRPAQMVGLQPDDACLDEPTPFLVASVGMGAAARQPLVGDEFEAAGEVRPPRRR